MSVRVEIVSRATEQAVKVMRYDNKRLAEKAESGVQINLDHERYFTRVIEEDVEEQRESNATIERTPDGVAHLAVHSPFFPTSSDRAPMYGGSDEDGL